MTISSDPLAVIRLLQSIDRVATGDELIAWTAQELHPVLPHGAFICGIGRVHSTGVAPVKLFASNFPADYLASLKLPGGLFTSPIIKNWQRSGGVQLFDASKPSPAGIDAAWLKRFKASGLKNIAAHGAYDLSRQYASYFSFHQLPGTLGQAHRDVLQLLTPQMHMAMVRIIHKLKADAQAARKSQALSERELEVLTWVCDGKTSAEIAAILGLSQSTVRNQIQNTLVKLRVSTRSQAVAKALKKGLVVSRHPDSQFSEL